MTIEELLINLCHPARMSRGEFVREIAEFNDREYTALANEIQKLMHHKDSTCGLYALDSDPGDLLHKFWQKESDSCPLECTEAEKQQDDFYDFVTNLTFKIEY